MQSYSHRQERPRRVPASAHLSKPWKKLVTFFALIAIPAICTAVYVL